MDQKCDRLYPSAPFENKNIDLEQRLEKKTERCQFLQQFN